MPTTFALWKTLPILPFERIYQPLLLLHSRYDGDVALEHAQSAQTQLPNAQLIIMEGCGHFLWLGEHGRQVIARRNAFLHTTHSVTVGFVGDEADSD